MSDSMVSAILQLVVSLGGAGLLVQLLLLRANRRKIAGEATSNEANAASTLSGAALKMVESAQKSQHEAEKRAEDADARVAVVRTENATQWSELNAARWHNHRLEQHIDNLGDELRRAGRAVPPTPDPPTGDQPTFPPPAPRV